MVPFVELSEIGLSKGKYRKLSATSYKVFTIIHYRQTVSNSLKGSYRQYVLYHRLEKRLYKKLAQFILQIKSWVGVIRFKGYGLSSSPPKMMSCTTDDVQLIISKYTGVH